MDNLEKKWTLPSLEEDRLKQIAKDLYDNKIFCDRHLSEYDRIESHFMALLFMGPIKPEPPNYPSDNSDLQGSRDNKLYDLVQRDLDQKEYERKMLEYPKELEDYNEYTKSIGFIYEYLDSSTSPMTINGKPVFFSVRFLNHEDTKKMFEYYNQYKSIREQADNF
jgi:hypothetical protein